jgi:hypothetical protein
MFKPFVFVALILFFGCAVSPYQLTVGDLHGGIP